MTATRTMGLAPVLPAGALVETLAEEYIVLLPIPGFDRRELEVEIGDHVVTVRGNQKMTVADRCPFHLHERVEEQFELPGDVDAGGPRKSEHHRLVPLEHRFVVNADASGV